VSDREAIARAYEVQGKLCAVLEAPLSSELMAAAARDAGAGGASLRVAEHFRGDPLRGFLPLRVFAAVHRRVLSGNAPDLARCYPTAGGVPEPGATWDAFHSVLSAECATIAEELGSVPQTNEVARSTALLVGFLAVAREHGSSLHLLELGASAGLNLLWDRYRHEVGGHVHGDAASPVRISLAWDGPDAALSGSPRVLSRAGCDLAPRDIRDEAAVLWMASFVWPEHPDRLERLRAAVELARRDPPPVVRARAGAWIGDRLQELPRGATVVYHSAFWGYVPDEEQEVIRRAIEASGGRADPAHSLAWLRLEDWSGSGPALRLRTWPEGRERTLLTTEPHPRRLRWKGELIPSDS
jgi:hypothetical protein